MNTYSLNNVASNVVLFPVKPVAWYKFDNSITLDSSSNGYTLQNNGLVLNNTIYKIGSSSAACQSNFATIPTSINPFTINAYNGITFALWFRINTASTGRNGTLIYLADNTKANYISVSKNGTNNTLKFEINTNSAITDTVYIDNNWHHLIWSIAKNGKWTVYMDGLVTNITTIGSIPNVTNWNNSIIGGATTVGNYDDFRIYNSVMTASEAHFLYNSTNMNNVASGYGSIGIGKYSCNLYKLDVHGAINASNVFEKGTSIQEDWTKDTNYLYTNRNVGIGTTIVRNDKLEVYNGDIFLRNGTVKKTVVGDPSSVVYEFNEDPITGKLNDSNKSSTKFDLTLVQNNNIYDSTADMVAWYFTDPSDITKNRVSNSCNLSIGIFEYPPIITQNFGSTTVYSPLNSLYGNGDYDIRSSSSFGFYDPKNCFDKSISTYWASSNNAYNNDSNGTYVGTVSTRYNVTSIYNGEWIQIMLSQSILLRSYSLSASQNNKPKDWILLGSANGSQWVSLHNTTNNTWQDMEEKVFSINTNQTFKYFRICINKINQGQIPSIRYAIISEWKLFGSYASISQSITNYSYEDYDIQHLLKDNLSLVIRNTGTDKDYYMNVVNNGAFAPSAFTICFYFNFVAAWNIVPSIQTIVSCMHRESDGKLKGWEIQIKKTANAPSYELIFVTGDNTTTAKICNLRRYTISNYNQIGNSGWIFVCLSCTSTTATNNVSYHVYNFQDRENNFLYSDDNISYSPHSNSSLKIGFGINNNTGMTDNLVYNGTKIANLRFYNKILNKNQMYQLISRSLSKQTFNGKNAYVFNGNNITNDDSRLNFSDKFYKQYMRYNPSSDNSIIKYLLNTFHTRGFSVHFIYQTYESTIANNYQNNICFIGNTTAHDIYTDLIHIYSTKTSAGNLFYFKVINNIISVNILVNVIYTINLTCAISGTIMILTIYLNGNLSKQQTFTNYNRELFNVNTTNLVYWLGSHPVETNNVANGSVHLSTFKLQDYRMYPYALSASTINTIYTGSNVFAFDEDYQLERWMDSVNYDSSTSKYIYYNQGNVGIGTYDPGSYRLNVNSNLFVSGEILATAKISAYNDISDDRIKTVVGSIDNALESLIELSVFKYKTDNQLAQRYGFNPDQDNIGLSAQQVQRCVPEVITLAPFDISNNNQSISGNNYLAIKYKQLIPFLFAALKELINKYDGILEKYNVLYNKIKHANTK